MEEKAVVTVIGKNHMNILAPVAKEIAEANMDVVEVTQSIVDGYFSMVMSIDITLATKTIPELEDCIKAAVPDMIVHVMHQDIFASMHRI
ncbi:MAG: ACT domain-containing protein [Anaerovoracaceae bacterium]|jgi:ACT domain-containing protein